MIKTIEVDGYRLLDGFTADFRALTVVIGANAVGKSTLLDCLQCIAQCAEHPVNTVMGWHWGIASILNAAANDRKVSWRVTLEKPASPVWEQLPLEGNRPLVYEVTLQSDMQGQAIPQYEVVRDTAPARGYTEPYKFMEAARARRMVVDRRTGHFIPFDEAVPPVQAVRETPSQSATPNGTAPLPMQAQEAALMLSQIRFFNEFPVPSAVRLLLANMAFFPGFDVTRFSNLRIKPAEIRPVANLVPNGENLGTVLHEVLTRYDFRPSANDLREFLKAAYPTFEEIHCDTTYGTPAQVLVRLREKGMERSMELWELSDGMLRFLCLASALLNPVPPPFVMVDEPESGLHPRLMPVVADMIKTAAERTQVLVTTHSPDLLNRFDLADVAVMSRSADAPKSRWHRPENRKTLAQMLKTVTGESLGDLHRSGELEAIE